MRAIILYMLLVGLPLAGIAQVIYMGQSLKGPASVGGSWLLDQRIHTQPCAKALMLSSNAKLTIMQSGPYLNIRLDEKENTFSGHLGGVTISGHGDNFIRPQASGKDCNGYGGIDLTATIVKEQGEERLFGFLKVNNCEPCEPIQFSAVRATNKK